MVTLVLRHNQLVVIQRSLRWSVYTVEHSGDPCLETQPVGCYTEVTEVVCLYSGTCIITRVVMVMYTTTQET